MTREDEERSLDLVQRMIISALVVVVTGSIAAVLAVFLVVNRAQFPRGDILVLWVMTGVIGVITTMVVLAINRRRPYSAWVVLGLLPMAASAYWVLG